VVKDGEKIMPKPTLGIAMNCQNEAHHIPATLAQFFRLADDIVVVDGGSTDDTVEWAKKMGARVFHRPWKHNYADQKNFACQQLKTDWIYVHDPDERLEPTLLEIIPLLIDPEGQNFLKSIDVIPYNDTFDCFGIARRNYIEGIQTQHYPDYQYRLFQKHCFYSSDPAHRIHQEVEGFKLRTEVDYKHATFEDQPRFNILHYKTAKLQEEHDILFPRIMRGELDV
jgi:glycosyltransferase involved in cell wall biosynthesis